MFSFVAVEECKAILIDAKVLQNILMDNSKFAMMMYQMTSGMFKKAIINFISLAHKQKEGRIADIISYLADEVYHNNSFTLSLTRKEIAEFVGCSTENVIMTLSRWQTEKISSIEGKKFEILNPEKLQYIRKIG